MLVLLLALAACTSSPSNGSAPGATAGPAPATGAGTDGGSAFEPLPAGITVKDAFTAVLVQVTDPPTFPFAGSDGKFHVAYNVVLQNSSRVAATIRRLDVVDAADPTKVIASFADKQLVDPTCGFGDCNRLRALPAASVQDAVVPPQEARLLLIDFAFDSRQAAPKYVMHHLFFDGASSPVTSSPVPVDYAVTPYSISASGPISIGPPVKGRNWIALNGCCEPGWPHRSTPLPLNGNLVGGQLFAIDWKQTNDQGAFYTGDRTKNESYVDYGSDIIAVADGTVTATLDGQEANAPGVLPADDPVLGPKLTVENVDGNHIVLDIGQGAYAFYAHLLKDSLLVKVGDQVRKGQVIAKLGNTGNANASHMHFHVMNGPSVLGSSGIPYVLDSFEYQGQISAQQLANTDDYLTGNFFGPDRLAAPEARKDQLPMAWAIVNFPG
ncbi:M23 family metallopeptidase [Pseudonocardia charpentierae]|uniref:M23 family metallopeptidase n=1 Tax=Pseudonocardia charpentierae TaxID=3075545 RepID=A0ABU2NLZ9_9PSEU|nr:M23 family metallopeptidase [Pseudonocardia sp. DSM 45834]MDT0354068.1 M23 family metallopeptidase [Pseudonocardia sp. DSM 45834]